MKSCWSELLTPAAGLLLSLVLFLPSATRAFAEPEIAFTETEHDFGQLEQETVVSHTFRFANAGDGTLEVWEVDSPCECTIPNLTEATIAPGQSGELVITLDSERLSGSVTKEVFVRSNDPFQPEVTLRLYASVRPGLTVEPPTIDLGEIPRQGGGKGTVRLVARDNTLFQVKELTAGLPFISARVIEPAGGGPAASVTVEVTAAAGGTPGPFVDFLIMVTDHPRRQKVEVPIKGNVESLFRVEPARLAFGTTQAGGHELGKITITYTGAEDVNLLTATTSTPSIRAVLEPYPAGNGGHISVLLTEEAAVGRLAGTVTVTTDHPDEATLSLRVVGFVRK